MADLLASPADLRALLDETEDTLSDDKATVLLELATGAIQAATRQLLVAIAADTVQLIGDTDCWFTLPQRPVTAVTSVKIDGAAVTDYKQFGDRLWRRCGWAAFCHEPSVVEVTYSHGYNGWDQKIQPARAATLALAARIASNPISASDTAIDDYRVRFGGNSQEADLVTQIPVSVQRSLQKTYGSGAGLVRLG